MGNTQKEKRKRRAKGTGCLVNRNGIWYARWTDRGLVHFVSTGYRVGEKRKNAAGEEIDARTLAEGFLLDRTEHLRVRHREDAIAMLIRQMQTPTERLKDDISEMNALRLDGLGDAFANSARRPDCGDDMLGFYRACIRGLADALGGSTPITDIGDAEAERYARALRDSGAAASTYNKHMNALTLVWKVCGREAGLLPGENPWAGIARRKSDAHVRRAFTQEETDRILETATGEMRMLVAVLLYTGLRLGDACRLKWMDVIDGTVMVTTAKTGAKVAIPLHKRLAKIIGDGKDAGSVYVMPGMAKRYGKSKQGRSNVSRSVKRLIERSGIKTSLQEKGKRDRPDATAHSFRHTFVSRAIEAGVPPHIVQALVGHSSAAMTERYSHLSDKAVLEAFGRIGGGSGNRKTAAKKK